MKPALVAAGTAAAIIATLSGCSLMPRSQANAPVPDSTLQSKVCANGDGAVQAVELGGISTRWIANTIVDSTTVDQPIHDVAVAAAADPDDAATRDQLAAWVKKTCGG